MISVAVSCSLLLCSKVVGWMFGNSGMGTHDSWVVLLVVLGEGCRFSAGARSSSFLLRSRSSPTFKSPWAPWGIYLRRFHYQAGVVWRRFCFLLSALSVFGSSVSFTNLLRCYFNSLPVLLFVAVISVPFDFGGKEMVSFGKFIFPNCTSTVSPTCSRCTVFSFYCAS